MILGPTGAHQVLYKLSLSGMDVMIWLGPLGAHQALIVEPQLLSIYVWNMIWTELGFIPT